MTITRVGTSQKYARGWENAFGGKKEPTRNQGAAPAIAKKPAAKAKTKSAPRKTSKRRAK